MCSLCSTVSDMGKRFEPVPPEVVRSVTSAGIKLSLTPLREGGREGWSWQPGDVSSSPPRWTATCRPVRGGFCDLKACGSGVEPVAAVAASVAELALRLRAAATECRAEARSARDRYRKDSAERRASESDAFAADVEAVAAAVAAVAAVGAEPAVAP